MKFDFELDIYEKVDPICLVINKDVRLTNITFLQVLLSTFYSQASFSMHNPFIYVWVQNGF